MTNTGNNDIYEYFFEGTNSINLIFSDGGNNQTEDLFRDSDGWYVDGVWSDTNPFNATTNPNSMTVHYKGNLNNLNLYYWNTSPGNLTTNWPGEPMEDEGNGWYKRTLDGVTCTNLIFSDNGNNQTADLSRCEDGWYFNGTWFDFNPEQNSSKLLDSKISDIVVFPNPWNTNSSVIWETDKQNSEIIISLSNINGQSEVIYTTTKSKGAYNLDILSRKSAGIYFLNISIGQKQNILKIIKP